MASSGQSRWSHRGFLGFTLAGLALYLPFLSTHYDLNGITEARSVELGGASSLWMTNHLLFRPVGWLVWSASRTWAGSDERALVTLQVLSALFGAVALGFIYVAVSRVVPIRPIAAGTTIFVATTWAHWTTSTDVAYVAMAAAAAAGAVALLVHARSPVGYIAVGAMGGVAILVWQANLFLVPGLAAGVWLLDDARPSSFSRRMANTLRLVASAGAVSLAGYLAVGTFVYGIDGPGSFFAWATTYGGSILVPAYGDWHPGEIVRSAATLFESVLTVSFVEIFDFRRRIGLAAPPAWLAPGGFVVLMSGLMAGTFAGRRLDSGPVRIGAWALVSYGLLVAFSLWWDEGEVRWLVVPNVFLAILVAGVVQRFWAHRATPVLFLAGVAFVGLANFRASVFPRHFQPSPMRETAACVARNMAPSDVLVASEWNWAGYLPYFHDRTVISLLDVMTAAGSVDEGLESAGRAIAVAGRDGGVAYVIDPDSYSPAHLDWLETQIGLDREDLDSFGAEAAFECGDHRFRILARDSELSP